MTGLRLRWWEILLLALPLGIALLFLVGGLVIAGTVLLAVITILIATRAEIVERNVAGAYATARGTLLWVTAAALFAIYLVIVVLFWIARRDHWSSDTRGSTAVWALAGLSFFVVREVFRLGNRADDFLRGGEMEKKVGAELDKLREAGWMVSHNLPRDRGNVDHFLVGPTGAYAIETKSGKYRASDRGQAISNAVWAKERFGQRFVTAVLCVATDPPKEPRVERHGNGEVWVLGPSQLRAWLVAYRWVPKPRR